MPTLIVHGTEDRQVPFAAAEYLAAHIAGAQLYPFQGYGHVPLFTATQEFCDVLRRFVRTGGMTHPQGHDAARGLPCPILAIRPFCRRARSGIMASDAPARTRKRCRNRPDPGIRKAARRAGMTVRTRGRTSSCWIGKLQGRQCGWPRCWWYSRFTKTA